MEQRKLAGLITRRPSVRIRPPLPRIEKVGAAVMKVANHICTKCGMAVEMPDYDDTQPLYEFFPKCERAVLKHGWQCHREDFPHQFRTFTEFMKWITTPEGREWDRKQGLIAEAERIVRRKS